MKINYLALYAIAGTVMLAVDGVWLGLVAKQFYADKLGKLMTDQVKWAAAILFYLLFAGLLVYFVIAPAITAGSWQQAVGRGALFGLATYATYDLTNYATLKGFALSLVVVDLIWGMTIAALTSVSSYALYTKLIK